MTKKAMDFILDQQKEWAKNKTLVSGKIVDGVECEDKNYIETIEDNLFPVDKTKGLRPENIDAYTKGGGSETKTITHRPKMSALHSSSALVVNLFQYWQNQEINKTPLLIALGLVNDNDKVTFSIRDDLSYTERLRICFNVEKSDLKCTVVKKN